MKENTNELINELYKTIEAKDNIINEQALEIARLKGIKGNDELIITKDIVFNKNEIQALLYKEVGEFRYDDLYIPKDTYTPKFEYKLYLKNKEPIEVSRRIYYEILEKLGDKENE